MTAVDFPEIDHEGHNVTASDMLNEHHEVQGVSAYGDSIIDYCDVCGFGAGWTYPEDFGGRDHFGHATLASVEEVQRWIGAHDNGHRIAPPETPASGSFREEA